MKFIKTTTMTVALHSSLLAMNFTSMGLTQATASVILGQRHIHSAVEMPRLSLAASLLMLVTTGDTLMHTRSIIRQATNLGARATLAMTDSNIGQQVLAWTIAFTCNTLLNPVSECRQLGTLWLTALDEAFVMAIIITLFAATLASNNREQLCVPRRLRSQWKQSGSRAHASPASMARDLTTTTITQSWALALHSMTVLNLTQSCSRDMIGKAIAKCVVNRARAIGHQASRLTIDGRRALADAKQS